MESVHEQVRFPCDLCDHLATRRDRLKAHVQKAHWNPNDGESASLWDQQTAAKISLTVAESNFSQEGSYAMRALVVNICYIIY